ncbi:MAG: cytochrome C oxidase subunit IV family protein [SAR324 cluster bacterium]|nr:cytochrome C oxidase subunit IV family protein [SAR324 cluster bacterium]
MAAEAHSLEKPHPGWKTYAVIAFILTTVTLLEVWIFLLKWPREITVPSLVLLSAFKFVLVAMYYMHLKFDHWIFRRILLAGVVLGFSVFLWLLSLYTFSHPLQGVS